MSVDTIRNENSSADYLRNADLAALVTLLQDHRTRAVDVVAPVDALGMRGGDLVLAGMTPHISEDGVSDLNGRYALTRVGAEGIGSKLDIPRAYWKRMASTNVMLLDSNVKSWLRHESNAGKKYLLRILTGGPEGVAGTVRAFLSDSYRTIDNLDVVLAALSGMQEAGVTKPVISADLTERRMVVRVTVPEIAALAPDLLKDYRNPWGGEPALPGWTPDQVRRAAGAEGMGFAPGKEPIIFAGFEISNSETGGGAFTIVPRLEVMVCRNGLKIVAKGQREVHLGGKLEAGQIQWSEDTQRKAVALVTAKTRDAVTNWLNVGFVKETVADLEKAAGIKVAPSDAPKVIEHVSKGCGFTKAEADEILNMFLEGGQFTAGGVMQAVTAAAHALDGDAAYDMENAAMKALTLAGSAARQR